jgi:hypothetical protein
MLTYRVTSTTHASSYVKFDPLLQEASTGEAVSVAGGGVGGATTMSLKERAQALLSGGAAAPALSGGGRMYTEAEKIAAVREAMQQAEEEAAIVQMESEELRSQLAAEREQNAQVSYSHGWPTSRVTETLEFPTYLPHSHSRPEALCSVTYSADQRPVLLRRQNNPPYTTVKVWPAVLVVASISPCVA